MWNVHEAAKASAICARAGIGRIRREEPWIWEWLYHRGEIPADAGGFKPTGAMLAFRKESRIRAILAAAKRSDEQLQTMWRKDCRKDVGEALLSYWRNELARHQWFERWLLIGEDTPACVRVVTAQEYRRCSCAWDFAAFCKRLSMRTAGTYVQWISRGLIPSLDWLKWLFGAPPPPDAFVVELGLQKLRHEQSRKGILQAAGLSTVSIWAWERDARTSSIIRAILAGDNPAAVDGWKELPANIQRRLGAVFRAASETACCARAHLSRSGYYNALREAERGGLKNELIRYLRREEPYDSKARSGMVAPNFFIPTKEMLRFREQAELAGAKQTVWPLYELPGVDAWFADWTAPRAHRGRRHMVPPKCGAETYQAGTGREVRDAQVIASSSEQVKPTRKPRGRPLGTIDPDVAKRKRKMLAAWDRGEFETKVAAAKEYDFHRSDATKYINEHEAKKCRK
jgi:hypothetical protein